MRLLLMFGMLLGVISSVGAQALETQLENAYLKLKPAFSDAVEVSVTDALARAKVVYVDVRSDEERNVSIIPGAISLRQFEQDSQQYKSATLIAYCTIGYRSGKFATKWRAKGFDVHNLKGGVLAWAHAAQRFATPAGSSTTNVHVYDKDWNFLPENYTPVW